ncbi:histidine kinase [Streptomyces sp. NPDC096013]|uniref:sensor histidine kinase n=1 Tax=Streptomyces sp. NPDC096013 TaxID=3366069 RepID=UPI00380AE948
METIRNWLLPALLAVGQAAWFLPGNTLREGELPSPAAFVVIVAAVVVETVALGWRRRTPVAALGWTLGASLVVQSLSTDGSADVGPLFALYSVAVRCPTRVTVLALAATTACDWGLSTVRIGLRPSLVSELAIAAVVYVTCAGLGAARRQWLAGRLTAARLLAGAEESRQRAGDIERHRLARELHDVSAHHLTSVVVTVDAARRLGGSRPELAVEALAFAERTGGETLTAIRRLVAVMRTTEQADTADTARDPDGASHANLVSVTGVMGTNGVQEGMCGAGSAGGAGRPELRPGPRPMTRPIEELVAGFGRLGRPIATRMPDDLAGPAGEAVFGIVREALTNALRYAPGAAVRIDVRREEGALDLAVDNDPPRASAQPAGAGLGSGRGVAGMRERAAAVGGELTAGPGPGGGWRVRATLPDSTGPRRPVVRSRRRDFLREQRLTDGALAFTATVAPLLVALVAAEEWTDRGGWALSSIGVLSVLLALHALPLLWRRRAPWAALAGVMATAWLWPVVRVFTELPSRFAQFLVGGGCAELLVVYAVAAYGRGAGRTWPAAVAPAFGLAGAVTATAAADGSVADGSSLGGIWAWALAVLVALAMGLVICLFLAPVWVAGVAVRGRRLRVLAREDSELADSVRQAEAAAEDERRRLAVSLQDAVLRRTAGVVELARQGRLDEVAAEARSALAAMRELLHSLGDAEASRQRLAPQPTAAELDALCHQLRSAGREVTLRGIPEAVAGLPVPVALSAYRVVEAALGAGDRGPARVTLRRRRNTLHITVAGVRLAVAGPVAERLRVQATSAEGRITLDTAGTVRVSLPAGPSPAPVQEVPPSPYA